MAKAFIPSFRSLEGDIERYLKRYGERKKVLGQVALFGYDKAMRRVFDLYVEGEADDPVVDFLLTGWNYEHGLNDYFREASRRFLATGQKSRLHRIWRHAITVQKQFFWELKAHSQLPDMDKSIAAAKATALETMAGFRAVLEELGDGEAQRQIDEEIAMLRAESRPKVPGKADSRTMTDELFWELIEKAAAEGPGSSAQVAALTERLARFKATQIKAFGKRLSDAMDQAYHYDLWALAFLVQGGCSDDAFEAFRAWLVLNGRRAFQLALSAPVEFLRQVPVARDNDGTALLQVPAIAYEWRTGKALKPAKRRAARLHGEPWEEEDLAARYPGLMAELTAREDPR